MLDLTKFKVFIVGGYVRDRLLGRECKDHDFVVVGATPADMLDAGFKQVGADFPVFLAPNGDEYALARTERKTSPGYHGFDVVFDPSVTLEDDLRRRDLTINAMAREVLGWNELGHAKLSDQIIDPFGGQMDLAANTLRHVSDAFAEDPLRILRTARFRARYDFDVAPETIELMKKLVNAGEVDHLTPERVWAEMERALMEKHPTKFFWTLDQCGASQVLFPELHRHTIFCGGSLDRAAMHGADLEVRVAVLTALLPAMKVVALMERLRAPETVKWAAIRTATILTQMNNQIASADKAFEVLASVDGFRQPNGVIVSARAVLFMHDERANLNMDRLLRGLRAALSVSFASLTKDQQATLKGKEIGEAIAAKRLSAFRSVLP
jgi:tRNA nucleotidyltransferase (CCA-adding enzyme)